MVHRSPPPRTEASLRTTYPHTHRKLPWRDVLVVATALTVVPLALLWAVSTPLAALAVVAVGALTIRGGRTLARRDPPAVRRAWSAVKRVFGRPAEP